MKPFVNIVDEVVGDLNNKEVNGKKFSAEFQLDEIPLWWFYRRFITSHVLPKQFNTVSLLEKKKISLKEKIYYSALQFSFRKYFQINEKIKLQVTKNDPVKNDREKVLFLTYTNHLNTKTGEVYRVNNLAKKLQEEQRLDQFVLFADPLSLQSYKQLKLFEHTIYQYITEEDKRTAQKISQELFEKWKRVNQKHLFGEHWPSLKYTLQFFFSPEFLYNLILYYQAMQHVLREENIKMIILTSRNGFFEKCIIAAAHKQKIPLVVVQHGMGMGTSDPELFPGMKIAVFGAAYREKLTSWGINQEDIIITGPIIFEQIQEFIQSEKKATGKVLLITDQYIEENYIHKEKYFQKIEIILQQLQTLEKEIVIKLHPVEKHFAEYVSLIEKNGWNNIQVTQERGSAVLYNLINNSDVVINSYSTVALEAMILGKPILTINIGPNLVPDIENSIFAGGIHCTLRDNIAKAAQEAVQDSPEWQNKRKRIVERYCYKIDGKATERLVKLVYNLSFNLNENTN